MKKKLVYNINVTKENIAHGEPRCENTCPIAIAIKNATHRKFIVDVNVHTVNLISLRSANTYEARLPKKGSNFVNKFDSGEKVKPISLELEFKNISAE